MDILIACESSGTVREAFRALGHDAWSCDLLPPDDHSLYHIEGDCWAAIECQHWDLIIMHPPCTALCVSGNRHYGEGKPKHQLRKDSIVWTMSLWAHACNNADHVAMENPIGVIPMPASQTIQPWQYGHGETKATCLWLHNLPLLTPTNVVEGRDDRIHKLPPSPDRWKIRSKTYQGIADAMASQWSEPKGYQQCLV